MILTIISWCWIALTSFLCGFAVLRLTLDRKRADFRGLDMYLLCGLCVLTVYSQVFSLFYKVGFAATALLAVFSLASALVYRKPLWEFLKKMAGLLLKPSVFLPVLFIMGAALLLTVLPPIHYDTDLYHAQSIRWIEEYGVVKGLGNLHNRLAYNSSFFCLQALFSLEFALNQSLHTLNGFITAVMLVYAVATLHIFHKKPIVTSDLLKLGLVFYFCFTDTRYYISSPNSDILTLSLVLYICAKWAEYMENTSQEKTQEYGLLCLLAVWAVSIKLSAGMLVLLTIYPAVLLIRRRQWKTIACFLAAGVLIMAPFLARNVMVSGYLVYPYSSIDLFNVDWKMSSFTARDDSREIMAWGRGMTQRENYEAPLSQWFPVWYGGLDMVYRVMLWLNGLCLLGTAVYAVRAVWKRKGLERLMLLAAGGACLMMWLLTSPLIRYGEVYMLLMPAVLCGLVLEQLKAKAPGYLAVGIFLVFGAAAWGRFAVSYGMPPVLRPADYNWRKAQPQQLGEITVYIGADGDQLGYHYFPGTVNQGRLEKAALRTGQLEDGFCLKEEYRDRKISTDGDILQ